MAKYIAIFLTEIFRVPVLALWYAFGWRVDGEFPPIDKFILVAVPHTSNWDYVHMVAMSFYYRRKPSTLVKAEAFNWFLVGRLIRWAGGIPIARGQSKDGVTQVSEIVNQHKRIVLVITPEGTRRKVDHWKTGFYYIALETGLPCVLGYLDYQRKRSGGGILLQLTGDVEKDLADIREFYATTGHGKYPENTGEIRFR